MNLSDTYDCKHVHTISGMVSFIDEKLIDVGAFNDRSTPNKTVECVMG